MEGGQQLLEDLDAIQNSVLSKHFKNMAVILTQNKRYAFNLIKNINSLYPSLTQNPFDKFCLAVERVKRRQKELGFNCVKRRGNVTQHQKSKGCLLIAKILVKNVHPQLTRIFCHLQQLKISHKNKHKDQQLFLMIMCSNARKGFAQCKINAFQAIKNQAHRNKLNQYNVNVMKLQVILKEMTQRRKRSAMNELILFQPADFIEEEDQGLFETAERQDSEEYLMIECYKSMVQMLVLKASNLSKVAQGQDQNINLKQIQKGIASKGIFQTLEFSLKKSVGQSMWTILRNPEQGSKEERLRNLRRQIAILQKQFESC